MLIQSYFSQLSTLSKAGFIQIVFTLQKDKSS